MWKFSGKIIFPRWQTVCQNAVKCHTNNQSEIGTISSIPDFKRHSHQEEGDKQHAKKQHQGFSDDPHFQNFTFCNNLLETVGWVGTAAICLDLQHNLLQKPVRDGEKHCLFSNLVYAMPKLFGKSKQSQLKLSKSTEVEHAEQSIDSSINTKNSRQQNINIKTQEAKRPENILGELNELTVSSISSLENAVGGMLLKQDKRQAFNFFKASSQLGCPRGLFNLALCYETGCGTPVDMQKTVKYYEQASAKGHILATYNLAVCLLKDSKKNTEKGLELMKLATEAGVHQAQVYLGAYYLQNGNYVDAFKLFTDAAEKSIEAKYYLGLCYENGWGIAANRTVAKEMYAQAARLGHQDATLKLGLFHEKGSGKDPNEDFSMVLYKMLADIGHKGGKRAMAALEHKQAARWKFKSTKTVSETDQQKTLPSIHMSASVPEFKNYTSQLKDSRCSSVLVLHSRLPFFSAPNHNNICFSEDKASYPLSLDLAVQNTLKLSPIISRIVSTKS